MTLWSIKETLPNECEIRYYFKGNEIHKELVNYKIDPSPKSAINSFIYPDTLEMELIKKRAEILVWKIDSANKSEIDLRLKEIFK